MLTSVLVRAVVFAPPALVMILFSQVSPIAPYFVDGLVGLPHAVGYVACIVTAALIAYLWRKGRVERPESWLMLSLMAALSVVLCFPSLPCVVVAVLTMLSPVWVCVLVRMVPEEQPEDWIGSVICAFVSASIWCAGVWALWLIFRLPALEKWTDWPLEYRDLVDERQSIPWKIAMVEWAVPIGISGELAIMATLCWFQKKQLAMDSEETPTTDGLSPSQAYLVSKVKLLGLFVVIAVLVLWLGVVQQMTSEGEERDMRDEVLSLAFWVFASVAAWLVYNLGPEQVLQAARTSKVAQRVLELAQSEWAKAGYLFVFAPFLLIHHLVKKYGGENTTTREAEEDPRRQQNANDSLKTKLLAAADLFGREFLEQLWTTGVLVKAQLLGVAYVCFEVGVKATLVGLAYTNELLAPLPVGVVALAIFLIGTFLFLLPPTPGPPVYALIGIVVTASATNSGWSAASGVVLAIFVGYAVKMVFAAVAQKFIGEPMANSVYIRSLVQVHTAEIRAIEMILKEPGITAAKVSILLGGPDWPVAVLCGMLKVSLSEVMLALSPVLFQAVVPCVLSGGLLVIYGDDPTKKALGESAVAMAGAMQVVAMVVAGYYVQEAIELHFDDLQNERPEDREILALEKESEKKDTAFKRATKWESLPKQVKYGLLGGLICVYISCLLLAGPWKLFLGTSCFKKFEITGNIQEALGGNALSVVRPLGWAAIAFCALSGALVGYFYHWAQGKEEKTGEPESRYEPLAQPDEH